MPKSPKSPGRAYDLCNKSRDTRAKMYRKNKIQKQRKGMCSPGMSPRCVKGLSYCVRTRSKSSYKRRRSKARLSLK